MLDPRATDVLGRRVGAWLINLALVLLPTLAVLWASFERIPITARDATNTIVTRTQAEYDYIQEVKSGFHRMWDSGDTLYILSGYLSVILPLLVLLLGSLVVFLLLPANTGWSPGHRVFGLRICDDHGQSPTVQQLVIRWCGGWIDALPWVIPGLVGFVIAAMNEQHQRLGDKFAHSYVVDAREPVKVYSNSEWAERERLLEADPSADLDEMVDLNSRLRSTPSLRNDDAYPETDDTHFDLAGSPLADTPDITAARVDDDVLVGAPDLEVDEPADSPEVSVGAAAAQFGGPEPGSDRSPTSPVDSRIHAEPAPTTHGASSSGAAAVTTVPGERIEPGTVSFPKPQHRASARAAAPVAHPAPTWDPSHLGEPVDTQRLQPPTLTPTAEVATPAVQAAAPKPTAPEWDTNWQAWLCYDPSFGSWMRHDPETGRWNPIG